MTDSKYRQTLNRIKTFSTGALLGAAIGAAAALLNAPNSGKKTRRKLQHRFWMIQDRAETALNGVQERAQETTAQVQKMVTQS